METKETIMLRQEIQALRDKVSLLESDLAQTIARADFDREAQLKFVMDRLKAIDVFIFASFNKLFPEFAKTSDEIDNVIGWKPTGLQLDLPNGKKSSSHAATCP